MASSNWTIFKQALAARGQPNNWGLALLVGNVCYLLVELSFNAHLTDIAATCDDVSKIRNTEIYGRMISAVGATLIALRIVGFRSSSVTSSMICLSLTAGLTMPLIYYGQRALVDFLVDSSGAETRRIASYLNIMRRALAVDAVRIEGFPYEAGKMSHDTKVFFAVSGILAWNFPSLMQELTRNIDEIVLNVVTLKGKKTTAWRDFQEAADKIRASYSEYYAGAEKYAEAVNTAGIRANEAFDNGISTARLRWREIETARSRVLSRNVNIGRLDADLRQYFYYCPPGRRCTGRADETYRRQTNEVLGQYVDPMRWCYENRCPGSTNHLQNVVDAIRGEQFQKRTGFPISIDFRKFLSSERVVTEFRGTAAQRGVSLPDDWTPNDRLTFVETVRQKIVVEAEKSYASAFVGKLDEVPASDLSQRDFVKLWSIQMRLRTNLGLAVGTEVDIDWSFEQFDRKVLIPRIMSAADRIVEDLHAPSSRFADSGDLADPSKDAVRSVVVPAVALGLSLFFGLTNAISTFRSVFCASLFVLVRKYDEPWRHRAEIWISGAFIALALALVLVGPYFRPIGIASAPAFKVAIESARENNVALAAGLSWVLRLQPVIYPVGESIRRQVLADFSFN